MTTSGSNAATVKGINTVPLCTGFTPSNGQYLHYTTGSSPNPCWEPASGGGGGNTYNGSGYTEWSAGATAASNGTFSAIGGGQAPANAHGTVDTKFNVATSIAHACVNAVGITGGGSITFTLANAGSAVGTPGNIAITVTSGTIVCDDTNSYTTSVGDTISWAITVSGTVGTPTLVVSAQIGTGGITGSGTSGQFAQWNATTGLTAGKAVPTGTVVGTSDTQTFTNKTMDVEATGNNLSIVGRTTFIAAGCGNSLPYSGLNFGASNIPTATCIGTNSINGYLLFAQSNVAYVNWRLPDDWNSSNAFTMAIDTYINSDTTNGHTVIWDVKGACNKTDGTAADDPSLQFDR